MKKNIRTSLPFTVVASVLIAFAASFATLPTASFVTSLPVMAAASFLALSLVADGRFYLASAALFPFLLNIFYDFGTPRALAMALLSFATAFFVSLFLRAVKTVKNASDRAAASKARVTAAASLAACAALWLFGFGDPVSWIGAHNAAGAFLAKTYGTAVTAAETSREPTQGRFLTALHFGGKEAGERYLLSLDGGVPTRNDYQDYCVRAFAPSAKAYYQKALLIGTDSIDVCVPPDDVLAGITPDADYRDYLDHVTCIIRVYEQIHDREDFESVFNYMLAGKEAYRNGYADGSLRYDTLILAARTADGGSAFFAVKEGAGETRIVTDPAYGKTLADRFGFAF